MKKMTTVIVIILLCLSLLLSMLGCTNNQEEKQKIIIAEQYGLAYAPIEIMKELNLIEKRIDNVEIEWIQLSNTAAIREAMLAGKCDIGFMAIPPFLIGWDNGMEWKIMTGLSSAPVGLVTNDSSINSIKDFTDGDRIALPQLGSIQHILLSMACEKEFGKPDALDNLVVSMNHPDGMNAIMSNTEITGHFTSPPYIFKELDNKNMHQVLSGEEAMGTDFSFIVGVSTKDFHDSDAEVYFTVVKAIQDSIKYINNKPEKAVEILSSIYDIDRKTLTEYIDQISYDKAVKGMYQFANFMNRNQYINNTFEKPEDVMWEFVNYEK